MVWRNAAPVVGTGHGEAAERESMSDVLGQWGKLMQASICPREGAQ